MASDNILNPDQKTDFFRQLRESRKVIPKETLIIDRSGIFGSDLENIKCHFNCPAGSNLVVVTLDNNVYPCIFLA